MTQTVFAPWEDPNETPLIQFKGVTKRFGVKDGKIKSSFEICTWNLQRANLKGGKFATAIAILKANKADGTDHFTLVTGGHFAHQLDDLRCN